MDLFSSDRIPVLKKFHNDFYALRIKAIINDNVIYLERTPSSFHLVCDTFNVQLPFQPLFNKLKSLLTQYGITSIISCYADPLPVLQVHFDNKIENIRKFLSHISDITPHIWILLWESFISKGDAINGLPLLTNRDEESDSITSSPANIENIRLQNIFRSSSQNCQLELLYVSPNYSYKEVKIHPVTLANYSSVAKAVSNSFVFEFQAAMNTYLNDRTQQNFKDLVSLEDLKTELKSFSGWFHLAIILRMPFSLLMSILLNYKHHDVCLSQTLSFWYNRNTDVLGDNQLTWTAVARIMLCLGRKSIADSICHNYGITSKSFEPLEEEVISAHGRLLSHERVKESLIECTQLNEEIIDKTKVITLYRQQMKTLQISLKNLQEEMMRDVDDARFALQMKRVSEREYNKILERVQALKTALRLLRCESFEDEESDKEDEEDEKGEKEREEEEKEKEEREKEEEKEDGEEQDDTTQTTSEDLLIRQSKIQLREMYHELNASKMSQLNDGELAQVRLTSLIQQISFAYDKILKEYNLLVSKCHQIHQAESALDELSVKVLKQELMTDNFLQFEVAAKSKSENKVLKIQRQVIEEEMAERESTLSGGEVPTITVEEVSGAQSDYDKMSGDVMEWMSRLKASKKGSTSELSDEQISELLENVEGTMSKQKSLLKAKMSSWSAKRSHRLTSAEQNVLQLILDSLKADSSGEDQTDGSTIPQANTSLSSLHDSYSPDTDATVSLPTECYLSLTDTVHVHTNKFIKFTIEVNEKSMKINPKRIAYTTEIRSLANNSTVSIPLIWDSTKNTLSVTFQPTVRGRHQLYIKANNKIVKTVKPFTFYANQSPKLLGYPVRTIESLNFPYNIQIVPNSSNILVSECKTRSVTLRDKVTGKLIHTIVSSSLKLPNGIAIDSQGLVYIVDSASHCVHTYTLEGVPVSKTGSKGEAYSMFEYPYGIQISPIDGSISVCDHCNDRVQIFTSDMKFQKALYAVTPYDIAFDEKGCIYVTDHENHLVAVFNESLQCINSIAGKGSSEGKLLEPRGVAINREGYIFVAEERNNRVSVFNSIGEFVMCFGCEGNQLGEFNCPQGLSIDQDGYIYVCDMLNNRIQVF